MKTRKTALLLLIVKVFFAFNLMAADIFVSTTGSNTSGDGSIGNPYATIEKACDFVGPGDFIYLRGGVYTGIQHKINPNNVANYGTAANPITVKNYDNEEVILDGTGLDIPYSDGLLQISNWQSPVITYYIVDGLIIRNSNKRGISYYNVENLIIRNCTVHDVQLRGIGGWGHYVTIENNEVYNAGMINENGVMGTGGWPMMIYGAVDWQTGAPSTHLTIKNNYVHNSWGEAMGPGRESSDVIIENNIIRDVFSVGIYIDKATSTTIRENYLYATDPTYYRFNRPFTAIGWANEENLDGGALPVQDIEIYNNLIAGTGKGINYWHDDSNSDTENSYHNITVVYNTIVGVTDYAISLDEVPAGNTQPSGCIFKNNIVENGSQSNFVDNGTAWTFSYNCWVDGIPYFDGSSVSFQGQPHFANPSITGSFEAYKLTSWSECLDAGTPITGITTDYSGTSRDAGHPAIGMHEPAFSVYYVDAAVSSSGNGQSWGTAKKSIGEATNLSLNPGDIVYIKPGTYPEDISIESNGAQIVGISSDVMVSESNKITFPSGTDLSGIDLDAQPEEYYAYVFRSWKSNNGYFKITEVDDANDFVIVKGSDFRNETGVSGDLNYLSAAIGRPVVYKKYSNDPENERVVLDCSTVPSAYTILYIGDYIDPYDAYPADFNIIDGLDVTASEGGIGLSCSNFNVITNGKSYSTTDATGCILNGNADRPATYNFIMNYEIYDVIDEGIYIGAGDNPQYNNHTHYNHIIGNEIYMLQQSDELENAIDVKEYNTGNLIAGNTIRDLTLMSEGNGILDVRNDADNTLVYNNVFKDIIGTASSGDTEYILNVYPETENVVVFNNLIYRTTANQDYVHAANLEGENTSGNYFVHNTIYNIDLGILVQNYGTSVDFTIANNIFNGIRDELIMEWTNTGSQEGKFTFQSNLFNSDPSSSSYLVSSEFIGDPNFADVSSENFQLTSTSLKVIDKGTVLPFALIDKALHERTNGYPDPGAYEFTNNLNPINYYVNKLHASASDANEGTDPALPWKSIYKAANSELPPGSIVNISPAVYDGTERGVSGENILPGHSGTEVVPLATGITVSLPSTVTFPASTDLSRVVAGVDYAYVARSMYGNNGVFKVIAVNNQAHTITLDGDPFQTTESGTEGNPALLSCKIAKPIIYKNTGGGDVVIDGEQRNYYSPLFVDGRSYLIFDGLDVTDSYYSGFKLNGNSHFNAFMNGKSYSNGGVGVFANSEPPDESTYNYFINNSIYNNYVFGGSGESFYIGDGGTPANNNVHFTHILNNTIYETNSGKQVENQIEIKDQNTYSVIAGNEISNTLSGINNGVIQTRWGCNGTLIYGNILRDLNFGGCSNCESYAIKISTYDNNGQTTSDIHIFNNLIYNIHSDTENNANLFTTRIDGDYTSGIMFAHNTIHNVDHAVRLSGGSSPGVDVLNNIIDDVNMEYFAWNSIPSGFTVTGNLCGEDPGFSLPGGNFIADPGFVLAAADNFHITSSSSAKDNGVATSPDVGYDFNFLQRDASPDIGAFEFQPLTSMTWTGSTSSDWTMTSNWSNATIPDESSNITIQSGCLHYPFIENDETTYFRVNNLTIENSGSLEISPTGYLLVAGILTNNSGSSALKIHSAVDGTGSLIHHNTGVSATVERHISAWTSAIHGWHFLSSPVSGQAIQPEFVPNPPTASQDFFKWDEASATWINTKMDDGGNLIWNSSFEDDFVVGRGYLAAYDSDQTKAFEQVLNVEDVALTGLTHTGGDYSGWHLLGNPFASAIKWNDGNWNMTNIAGTAKIWNESNASYTDIPANGIIPAMNGFMVQVNESTGSLTIPAASRTHDDQSWYKNSGYPTIKLLVKDLDENTAQESTILFHPEATEGFDLDLDSRFLAGYAPQFYSVAGDEKLSTNALPINGLQSEIQMVFLKNSAEQYEIKIIENTENLNVILIDQKLELEYDLTVGEAYLFEAGNGDDAYRFKLKFGSTGFENLLHQEMLAWMNNNDLYVNATDKPVLVQVFNPAGQLLQFHQLSDARVHIISIAQPTGIYLVRVNNSDNCQAFKVHIIKN